MFNKYRARSAKQEISNLLWNVWDPIGVKSLGGPRDEYDDYVNGIYELLVSGASDEAVAQQLLEIVTETMGLSGATLSDMRTTVTALRLIKLPNG